MGILFKNKNFMLVYLGLIVSSIGDVLFGFAMGLYVLDITHSAFKLAIYSSIGAVTWLVLTPLGGVLTDRWNKVKILYITDIIRGISVVVSGFLLIAVTDNEAKLWILYFTSFVIAANGALFAPASQAMIPTTVSKEDLVHANSLMSLSYNVKDVFGMLLAGVLYALLGPIKIVFINGISYILSGISEMFIKRELGVPSDNGGCKPSVIKEFKEGIGYIVNKEPTILKLLVITNIVSLAVVPIQSVVLPYLFNEIIQAPKMHLSVVYAAAAFGGIVGSIIVSKKRIGEKSKALLDRIFIFMIGLAFMQLLLYTAFNKGIVLYEFYFAFIIVLFIGTGISNILFNVPVLTSVQKLVDEVYYGRVMSLFATISAITVPFSITFGGILVDKLGISYIFFFTVIALLVGLLLIKLSVKRKAILREIKEVV